MMLKSTLVIVVALTLEWVVAQGSGGPGSPSELADRANIKFDGPAVEFIGSGGQFKLYDDVRFCKVHFDQIHEVSTTGQNIRTITLSGNRYSWFKDAAIGKDQQGSQYVVDGLNVYFEKSPLVDGVGGGGKLRIDTFFFPEYAIVTMPDGKNRTVSKSQVKFNVMIENFPWTGGSPDNTLRFGVAVHCQRNRNAVDKTKVTTDVEVTQNALKSQTRLGFKQAGYMEMDDDKMTVDGVEQKLAMDQVRHENRNGYLYIDWSLPHFDSVVILDPELVLGDMPFDWATIALAAGLAVFVVALGAGVFCFVKRRKAAVTSV
jgi:hypothetical protein